MGFPLYFALVCLRPRRSFASVIPVVTVTGVALGVAILMIVLAVMTGFGDVWREKILSFKPHVVVTHFSGTVADPDAVCEAAEAAPGAVSAAPALVFPAMVRDGNGGDPVAVTVVGVDASRPSILSGLGSKMAAGTFSPVEDSAAVGSDLAWRLGIGPGSKILCYSPLNLRSADELWFPEEMRVSGVYDLGMRDFDDGVVVCSLGMARDLLGMDGGAGMVNVQVEEPEKAWEAAAAISSALGPEWRAATWEEQDRVLFDALRTEKTMMFVLLAFIAVVAAFCVTNTLIVITIQKTHDIGLLKALGFSAGQIRTSFVLGGLLQCVAGEALGAALGTLVLHNLRGLVDLLSRCGLEVFPKAVYGLAEIPWRIVPGDVAAVVATVFAFCFAAAFFPAFLASRLDPVKALNQK